MYKKFVLLGLVVSALVASSVWASVNHGPFLLSVTKTVSSTTYVNLMDIEYPVTDSVLQPGACFLQVCTPDTWSNSAYYFLQIKAPNADKLVFRWKRGNVYTAVDQVVPQDDGSIIIASQVDFNLSNGQKLVTLQAKKATSKSPNVTIAPSNNSDYIMAGVTVAQP